MQCGIIINFLGKNRNCCIPSVYLVNVIYDEPIEEPHAEKGYGVNNAIPNGNEAKIKISEIWSSPDKC